MSSPLKILISGQHGQVSRELQQRLQGLGELIVLGRDQLDLTRPEQIRQQVRAHRPDLIINAAGMLHDGNLMPEKRLADLDPATLARVLAVNTIGPALFIKHFHALLPTKERMKMMAERTKLEFALGGVKDMDRVPDAVFIMDLKAEEIALREATRLLAGIH